MAALYRYTTKICCITAVRSNSDSERAIRTSHRSSGIHQTPRSSTPSELASVLSYPCCWTDSWWFKLAWQATFLRPLILFSFSASHAACCSCPVQRPSSRQPSPSCFRWTDYDRFFCLRRYLIKHLSAGFVCTCYVPFINFLFCLVSITVKHALRSVELPTRYFITNYHGAKEESRSEASQIIRRRCAASHHWGGYGAHHCQTALYKR